MTSKQAFAQEIRDISNEFFYKAPHILEELNMGVLVLNIDGYILEMNAMAMKLFDIYLDRVEVSHLRLDSVISADRDEFALLQNILKAKYPYRNFLANWEHNGILQYILIDSYPIENSQGEIEKICIYLKDIGDFISMEQQIKRNDRIATVGKVAAGVAHEIRNPLTSIKGFLQFMKDDMFANNISKYNTYTDIMLTDIDRIDSLVNELLLLSKPKHNHFQPVDLHAVLHDILPALEADILLQNIEVRLQYADIPEVYADPDMLKQVFLNLIKNAIQAMPAGGKMTITTCFELATEMVRIDFQDTGTGIPHYMVDRIFDAFFTTKDTGTGLGLPICQRIITDLGGFIRVANKGFGATFSVFLPKWNGTKS